MRIPTKTISLLAVIFTTVFVLSISSTDSVIAEVDDIQQDAAVTIKAPALVIEGPSTQETTVAGLSSDGKIRVEIIASNPAKDEAMSIDIKFRDANGGSLKQHVNYDIVATQNGKEILSSLEAHGQEGHGTHNTTPLKSNDSVDIKVKLLGFGLPDEQENWTGPAKEILYFNVVPEFGTIAAMILAIATISIIAISAKSRLSIMPRF